MHTAQLFDNIVYLGPLRSYPHSQLHVDWHNSLLRLASLGEQAMQASSCRKIGNGRCRIKVDAQARNCGIVVA